VPGILACVEEVIAMHLQLSDGKKSGATEAAP
jgi:hypothetical protein